jgi:ATP-dependent RNA helicase RhlE
LLFSATMPREIAGLASDLLRDPLEVSVAPVATTAERVAQRVILVDTAAKRDVLTELMKDEAVERAIVFTRTKHGADRVARHLEAAGVGAQAIHGNKSQNQRIRALEGFRNGATRVLVATDIAARGIDVDGVTHVVNFELPDVPESYVHRIGRTARAGASGQAISLCDNEERGLLRQIEKLTRQIVPSIDRRSPAGQRPEATPEGAPARRGQRRGGHGSGHGGPANHGTHGGAGARENAGRPQRRPQYSGRGMPNGQRADRSRGA